MGDSAVAGVVARGSARKPLAVTSFSGAEILIFNLLLSQYEENSRAFTESERNALGEQAVVPMLQSILSLSADDARMKFRRSIQVAVAAPLLKKCGDFGKNLCFVDDFGTRVSEVTEIGLVKGDLTAEHLSAVAQFAPQASRALRARRGRRNA